MNNLTDEQIEVLNKEHQDELFIYKLEKRGVKGYNEGINYDGVECEASSWI